jgi:nitroreductase
MSTWHAIAEIARYAPSPHNTQPWKLKVIDSARADLFMVRRRMLPDEDTTGCFLICAMGIFIESLRIVAGNLGYRLESHPIDLRDDQSQELIPFAHLVLVEDAAAAPLFSNDLFLKRRTSRVKSPWEPASPAVLDELAVNAAAWGQGFHHSNDPERIEAILQKNTEAVFDDLNDARYHDEIMRWFRFGRRHERRTQDGLASRCMNVTAAELYLPVRFPSLLRHPLTRPFMRGLYNWRLGSAAQLGFLSGPFWDRAAAEHAGRALLHVWLTMTRHSVYIHPFGNLVTNADAHRWLTAFMGVPGIWLVFRFGRTRVPPQSLRLSTEDLFLA